MTNEQRGSVLRARYRAVFGGYAYIEPSNKPKRLRYRGAGGEWATYAQVPQDDNRTHRVKWVTESEPVADKPMGSKNRSGRSPIARIAEKLKRR